MSSQETNKICVFAGTCPDELCQSIVVFKPMDKFVSCQRCGQTHEKKRILDVYVIQENSLGMKSVLRSLILATNPNFKKATDTVKVNGLSNFHCKLLSPLFTEYGMEKTTLKAKPLSEITSKPTFDCSLLGERCFTVSREHLNIPGFGRDTSGSDIYLSETLKNIEEANGNKEVLVPLHADGDGHCLVHAISRALTGLNLFWHPLRSHLKRHLIERRETYEMLLADFINASEWDDIIKECDPKYEPDELKGEVLGLRNVHVFGLANVLKRPIILFDSLAGMKSSGDYSAVFLPSLADPEECKTKSGELNPPICIAWSNAGRGHFIPLVGIRNENPPAIPISMLPEVWAVSHSLMSSYMKFSPDGTILITGKLLQEGYIQKLVKCMNELFLQKYGVHPLLVCDQYQFVWCSKPVTPDVTPEAITNETRRAAQDHRLYRCIDCLALHMSPISAEWLRPGNNGVIYNKAVFRYGFLNDGCRYLFPEYGVLCVYDAKKDVLIVNSVASQKCSCCLSTRVRMVHVDGTVAYENGDITPRRSRSKYCTCGYKHFYGGKEYDNPPDMITVCMNWHGQAVFEDIAWFQFESDVSLNSNVFEIANSVVQKHFAGEFGTETLVTQVVEQLLAASKHIDERSGQNESSPMSSVPIPSKEEEVKSALQLINEPSTKCESPAVTAVIKLNEERIVQNDADSSVVSNLQELTNETKTLVLEQEEKHMYVESEKDDAVNTSEDVKHLSFEEDLRQVQLDLQAQQNEYKMKKLREYSASSSREKFLDLLSNPNYDALVNYGPNAVNHNSVWDVVSATSNGSSDSGHNSFHEGLKPATTVRVGPGYSVLAPRGGARINGPRSSRTLVSSYLHGTPVDCGVVPDDWTLQEDPTRSGNSSQMEDVKDNYNDSCRGLARSRVRGTTSARARSRAKRRD